MYNYLKPLFILLVACAFVACSSGKGSQLVGGYTQQRKLSADERQLFLSTYHGDVSLTPKSVATQVVAGTNYKYLCKDDSGNKYQVVIYQPLPGQGEASVTSTQSLSRSKQAVVIVFYDASVGNKPIEETIAREKIEVVYHYPNLNGYALKISNKQARKAIENTKGVLQVKDDEMLQLD